MTSSAATAVRTTKPAGIGAAAAPPRRMDPLRKVALAAGVLYLITFAASIPQLKLYADIVADPAGFVSGSGSNTAVLWGSFDEVITALSGVGTAIALYATNRRVSRAAAIGFITSRVVEGAIILVGVMSVLSVVTLKADFAGATGAQADSVRVTAEALVDARQWTFLLGPGIMPAINAVFLGSIMYRSGLVPRVLPTIGLIGAPLLLFSAMATLFGAWSQTSGTAVLFALPIAVWEFSLGCYLTFKGFKRTPLTIPATD